MRILIEVPTYDGRISQGTSESLWRLDRCGHDVDYRPRTGYGCAMARNRIAADALDAGYDYVLMVDNDITLPTDALRNLLEHGERMVLGYYLNRYARGESRLVCAYHADDGPDWRMYDAAELRELRERGQTLVPIKGGGMGCALVHADVFRRVHFPWFAWTDMGRTERHVSSVYECADAFQSGGEDINFCNRVRGMGIGIYADTRVACGHEFREVKWPE